MPALICDPARRGTGLVQEHEVRLARACALTPSRSAGSLRSASTTFVSTTSALMMVELAVVRLQRAPLLVGNGPEAGRSAVVAGSARCPRRCRGQLHRTHTRVGLGVPDAQALGDHVDVAAAGCGRPRRYAARGAEEPHPDAKEQDRLAGLLVARLAGSAQSTARSTAAWRSSGSCGPARAARRPPGPCRSRRSRGGPGDGRPRTSLGPRGGSRIVRRGARWRRRRTRRAGLSRR